MNVLHFLRNHWLTMTKGLILLGPITLSLWLVNKHVPFTKNVSYVAVPGKPSTQLRLAQDSLVATLGDDNTLHWRLNEEELNISLKIPRSFAEARLQLHLENVSQRAVVVSAKTRPGISLPPKLVDHEFLNQLPWPHITNGTLTLWQRGSHDVQQKSSSGKTITTRVTPESFERIEAFFSNPPPLDQIGVLNLDPNELVKVENYQPATEPITLPHSFRGDHTLLVYAQNERLDFSFDKVDLNRRSGADPLIIRVSLGGRELYRDVVADDGIAVKARSSGPPTPVRVVVLAEAAGVYEVQLDASEDVLVKNITTPQQYFTFAGHLFLADGPAYVVGEEFRPVIFSIAGNAFTAETPHDFGFQDFFVGNRRYRMRQVKQAVSVTDVPEQAMTTLARGDVYITAKNIAIHPAKQLSGTSAVVLPIASNVPLDHINYIVAAYEPRETYGPLAIDLTHRASDLLVKSKTISFVLEAPDLVSGRAVLEVKSARVTITRNPIPWKKIPKKIIDTLRDVFTP